MNDTQDCTPTQHIFTTRPLTTDDRMRLQKSANPPGFYLESDGHFNETNNVFYCYKKTYRGDEYQEGVLVLFADGNVTYWNPKLTTTTANGKPEDLMIMRSDKSLNKTEPREEVKPWAIAACKDAALKIYNACPRAFRNVLKSQVEY